MYANYRLRSVYRAVAEQRIGILTTSWYCGNTFYFIFLRTIIISRISYNTFMFPLNLYCHLVISDSQIELIYIKLQKKKLNTFSFSLFLSFYQFHVRRHSYFRVFLSIPEITQRFQRPTILRTNRSSVIFCRIVSRENSNIQRWFAFTNGKWRIHCIDYRSVGSMRFSDQENTQNVMKKLALAMI